MIFLSNFQIQMFHWLGVCGVYVKVVIAPTHRHYVPHHYIPILLQVVNASAVKQVGLEKRS